jgi:hypothetical protein
VANEHDQSQAGNYRDDKDPREVFREVEDAMLVAQGWVWIGGRPVILRGTDCVAGLSLSGPVIDRCLVEVQKRPKTAEPEESGADTGPALRRHLGAG